MEVARAGAEAASSRFRTNLDTDTKGDECVMNAGNVVTVADREAQHTCLTAIRDRFPTDVVVAEEDDARKELPTEGVSWVVDPIDGTYNFVRRLPAWATAVAVVEDGETICAATVAPALDAFYLVTGNAVTLNGSPVSVSNRVDPATFAVAYAVQPPIGARTEYATGVADLLQRVGETRRVGSLQVALARVATGMLDGVVTPRPVHVWDSVGGVAMVRAAGGVVTDVGGEQWQPASRGLVASNGASHEMLLTVAQQMASDD
jgi:myo-inositol-1(or 4)-monophosphatase